MKCLVAIKRVLDPHANVIIKADHSGVMLDEKQMVMDPFNQIAIEEGVRLKENNTINELVAISIGDIKCIETLKQALAYGADRAVLVETNNNLTPLNVAKILQIIAYKENPGLIITGKQSVDADCNQTGQMLAAKLNWSQGTCVSSIKMEKDKEFIQVVRETDNGMETLRLKLPSIITVDLRLNEPRYISLYNLMQAKNKQINIILLDTLNVQLNQNVNVVRVDPIRQNRKKVKLTNINELSKILGIIV